MSKTIYKYQLQIADMQEIMMPVGSEILCVQEQHNQVCLWAVVDIMAVKEPRKFMIIGTGHRYPVAIPLKYIGTFQLNHGSFVGHVFEKL